MAVLVALKLVAALNLAAMVLSCAASALCSVGVGCWAVPICAFTGNLKPEIDSATAQYQRTVVDTLLPALSRSQDAIALAMPAIAQAKAMAAAEPDAPGPERCGVLLGTSLASVADWTQLGLPIEDEPDSDLCARSGALAAEVAFSPFPFASWIASVTGELVRAFPAYFCSGEGELPVATEQRAVEQQCDLRRQAHEQESDEPFDLDACREAVLEDLRGAVGEQEGVWSSGRNVGEEAHTKRVSSEARNGNSQLQLRAISTSMDRAVYAAERGVMVAGGSAGNTRSATFAVAQAEFYYDTRGGWDAARSEALYNLRWRARLRRWRAPEADARLWSQLSTTLAGIHELAGCVLSGPGRGELSERCGHWMPDGADGEPAVGCTERQNILCSPGRLEVIH